ncbi:hypothetical protein BDD43_3920 [Mucilaginibacter gracilis]|uniref:Uncharacterized protein n=1 Tax=Mucilaginibacter gracilis TaxID=423350 RepID=A0A495J3Z6_9SPHI|nr:hypothetical protein BDD43_3920 [Mucilaginibacter gracilis]
MLISNFILNCNNEAIHIVKPDKQFPLDRFAFKYNLFVGSSIR